MAEKDSNYDLIPSIPKPHSRDDICDIRHKIKEKYDHINPLVAAEKMRIEMLLEEQTRIAKQIAASQSKLAELQMQLKLNEIDEKALSDWHSELLYIEHKSSYAKKCLKYLDGKPELVDTFDFLKIDKQPIEQLSSENLVKVAHYVHATELVRNDISKIRNKLAATNFEFPCNGWGQCGSCVPDETDDTPCKSQRNIVEYLDLEDTIYDSTTELGDLSHLTYSKMFIYGYKRNHTLVNKMIIGKCYCEQKCRDYFVASDDCYQNGHKCYAVVIEQLENITLYTKKIIFTIGMV